MPIIVKFCQNHQVPYNFTIYPNYIGHFSQIEAEEDLEPYEAIVDVQCYELASLFLCTLFVPKCGTAGLIPPCKSLCLGKQHTHTYFICHFHHPVGQFIFSPNNVFFFLVCLLLFIQPHKKKQNQFCFTLNTFTLYYIIYTQYIYYAIEIQSQNDI